jgi:hypothetical protein
MRLVDVRRAYINKCIHSYILLYIIYRQKPKEGVGIGIRII